MPRIFTETTRFAITTEGPDGPVVMRGHLTCSGPTKRIVVNGKDRYFTRDYSGCPWEETKAGRIKDVPPERDPFWRAFYSWTRQGEQMDGDLCLWDVMPPRRLKRLDRRNSLLVHEPPGWMDVDGEVWE
ncbi:hypothetical protein UFOVP469_52 [uncultured Caudovirales phage]|uniref:Uncharacterized protein n=1 Tax=uncultured Caudovirales phage TaxID=2100421 RepID=A0A6J5MI60_9CAUD|nr:hypothetical protein UFOVP469_52 [uncultured Caudovirales phage]CAB4189946.1 hypothetical protein UFOVP1200_25 [uncultured Caudovirales phage]